MTEKRVKVNVDGQVHVGVQVEIEESHERWTRVQLGDGSVLRMKTLVTRVARVPGKYDAEGAPVYVVRTSNILVVDAAEHLLMEAQESDGQIQ